MTNKSGIHPIDYLWHRQLSCGKYVICGNMLGDINKTTIHCQSMLCYLYGMEVKGQIVATTSVSNKIVRGFVSQEVHDIWAASRSDVLSKPWGIHHVDASKESCHFIEPQQLIALLERQVPLAKASTNIKPESLALLQSGPDLIYAAELIEFCRRLIQDDLDFISKSVNWVEIPAPHEPEAQKFSPVTMTFKEALNVMVRHKEIIYEIDEELYKIEEQANQFILRVRQLEARRLDCRSEIFKAARVIRYYEHGCPSTAPASEHPTPPE